MWLYLRRVPIDRISLQPALISQKYRVEEAIYAQLDRAVRAAAAHCADADRDASGDAQKFVVRVIWLWKAHLPNFRCLRVKIMVRGGLTQGEPHFV